MARRLLWNSLKYALALTLLGFVLYANWDPPGSSGLRQVWQAHVIDRQPINATALLGAFVLCAVSLMLMFVRWHILMRAQDLPVAWPTTLRISLLGYFFNTFLPGSVGGDLVKAAAVARTQQRRAVAVATVLMDRVLGLWSLISFAAVVGWGCIAAGMLDGPTDGPARALVLTATAVSVASVIGWILLGPVLHWGRERVAGRLERIPKVGGTLTELWNVAAMYRRRQRSMLLAIGLSWIADLTHALFFFLCALTLWYGSVAGPLPTLVDHFLLVPIGSIIAAIPLFPGGAGISEAGYGGLYTLFGAAASSGVLATLVSRFVTWIMGLVGYVVSQAMQWSSQPGTEVEPAVAVDCIEQARLDGLA